MSPPPTHLSSRVSCCRPFHARYIDGRIPAQLVYDWLAQLAVPPISIAELRRVLPQSVLLAVLSEEEKEATAKTVIADAGEGTVRHLPGRTYMISFASLSYLCQDLCQASGLHGVSLVFSGSKCVYVCIEEKQKAQISSLNTHTRYKHKHVFGLVLGWFPAAAEEFVLLLYGALLHVPC